jgi:hypothetical protein
VITRPARIHPVCRAEARLWSAAACCRFPPGQLAGRQGLPILSTAARASSLKESGSKLPHSRAPAAPFIRLAELSHRLPRGEGYRFDYAPQRSHLEYDPFRNGVECPVGQAAPLPDWCMTSTGGSRGPSPLPKPVILSPDLSGRRISAVVLALHCQGASLKRTPLPQAGNPFSACNI